MTGGKDSRVIVGGTVWARAEAISLDYKRILGNQFKTKWIEGSVVSVEKRKASDAAKWSTTYIEGKYPCGVDSTTKTQLYKVKFLSLQTLKAKDPFAVENVPPTLLPPPAPTQATTIHAAAVAAAPTENVQPTENPLTPPTAPEDAVATQEAAPPQNTQASNGSSNSSSTASTKVPVTTSNDRHWYDGNCNVEVNGKSSSRCWKLQDQYGRGTEFTPGCDRGKSPEFKPIDFILAVFPKSQLREMEERTSVALRNADPKPLQPTTIGELLKFFGVLLTITQYKFGL